MKFELLVKLSLLAAYFAALIWIGFKCRRGAGSVDGFVLGGRSVGAWLTAFAYGTSYFSAVVFVGYAGQFGWKYGISSTWVGIGNAVIGSLLAWMILGRRTRLLTQHLDSATMPDFFAKRFDSSSLKLAASVIIFVFLIPYTASLYNGLSRLFSMAFPGFSYSACIVVMAVLTAVYVIAGGYLATAINDFIQGIIMLGGLVAVISAVLSSKGGFAASLDGLARITDPSVTTTPGIFTSFFGPDPLNLLFVVILTSLGTWGLPQMVQKFYAIRNEGAIRKGTVISTLFAFVVAGGCYFLGGFGRLFGDKVDVAKDGFDAIIPAMLSNLGPGLIALTVILVLSASMSTLSSLVMTSSSTLTIDFIRGTVVKDMTQKGQVLCIRVLLVVFIAVSAALALGISLSVAAFPAFRGGTCPAGRYQVAEAFVLAVPVLLFLHLEPAGSRWRRRVLFLLASLGAVTISLGAWLAANPAWWFERYHPAFRHPRLQPHYGWLPDFDGRWFAPLAFWLALFLAATFAADLLRLANPSRRPIDTPAGDGHTSTP